MKRLLLLIGLCQVISMSRAQNIQPNLAFGQQGIVKTNISEKGNVRSEIAYKTFLLPDHKLLWVIEASGYSVLSRRLQSGEIDLSYGTDGYSEPVKLQQPKAVRQKDGKIILAGTSDYNNADFLLARYNEQGFLDASFGKNGITITDMGTYSDVPTCVGLQSDGKVIVGGLIYPDGPSPFGSIAKAIAVRYTPAGSLDNSFAQGGKLFFESMNAVQAMAIRSNDKIIFGGSLSSIFGIESKVVQYTAEGSVDNNFGVSGSYSLSHNIKAISIQADGKVVLGGRLLTDIFNSLFAITRLTENGSLDDTFNKSGTILTDFGTTEDYLDAIALDSKGRVIAAGYTKKNGNPDLALARYTNSGQLDLSFNKEGKKLIELSAYDDFATDVLIVDNDNLFITGYSYVGNGYDYAFIRLKEDGSFNSSFDGDGKLSGHVPALQGGNSKTFIVKDGKLLVHHTGFDCNMPQQCLVRYLPNGTIDKSYGKEGKLNFFGYYFTVQQDYKILVASFFIATGGTNIMVTRFNEDGTADLSFGTNGSANLELGGDDYIREILLQKDGKILVTAFTFKGSESNAAIVRLNNDGSIDNTFGENGRRIIDLNTSEDAVKIAVQEDGKIVLLGRYNNSVPQFDFFLYRFDSKGYPDETFGNNGVVIGDFSSKFETGNDLVIQPDGKLLVSAMQERSTGVLANFLVRYNQDGSIDQSFGVNGIVDEDVASMVVLKNGKILTSGGIKRNNTTDGFIGRLNQDGSPDLSFGAGGKIINAISPGDDYFNQLLFSGSNLYVMGNSYYLNSSGILAAYTIDEENKSNLSLTLVNATSNKEVRELKDGDVIELTSFLNARLNIRANADEANAGSIAFDLQGPYSHTQTENLAPYALFGDNMKGKYYGNFLPAGEYTLTVTPFLAKNGSGQKGTPLTIHFNVIYSATVSGFTLINAETDKELMSLRDGDTLNLATLPSFKLNIRANASPAVVGSMVFELSGTEVRRHTENSRPYALFVNNKSDYFAWTPKVGSYTLTATPHSARSGSGEKGSAQTIHFNVVYQPVQSLTLVNASTGYDIRELNDGDVVDLSTIPGEQLNIRANVGTSHVGSVMFELRGPKTHTQTENLLPYALFGDNMKGKYYGWKPGVGIYQLSATPYAGKNGKGVKGKSYSLSFKVIPNTQGTCPTPNFAPATIFPTVGGSYPHAINTADFNIDGKADIAVAFGVGVGVLLGNGNGGLGTASNYPSGGEGPSSIAIGDFNGDGHADIAVANPWSNNIGMLFGNGDGTFAPGKTLSSGGNYPYGIVTADFNGDNRLDLVVTNYRSNNIALLLNNGNGDFLPTTTFWSGGDSPLAVAVSDFNGDGKGDIAVANQFSDNIGILLNNGNSGFAPVVTFTSGGGEPRFLTTADFNSDGKPDIAIVNADYDNGNIGILINNGTGNFLPATTFSSGEYRPMYITTTDFNGDGKADIATANVNDYNGNVGVLLNNGSGNFSPVQTYPSGGITPFSLTVGDFNGDDKPDIAVANSYHQNIGVLLNLCGDVSLPAVTKVEQGRMLVSAENGESSLNAAPNPFTYQSIIRFSVQKSGYASLSMYDSRGVEVARLYQGRMEAGKDYQSSIEAKNLPAGVYLLRLTTENETKTAKVVLVR